MKKSILIPVIIFAVNLVFMAGCEKKTEENKAIARRVFEEIWNQEKLDLIDEIFATDYVGHITGNPDFNGPEGYKELVSIYLTAFPDVQYTIEDHIAEGDRVIIRWSTTATHKGELMGIPPTGLPVPTTGITIYRIAGGKILEEWSSWDDLGMWQQLGFKLVPPLTETTFARVTLLQLKADRMDESINLYKESVVSAAKSQKGYRGIYLLNDFKTGKGISISLWECEDDAIANKQSGYYHEQVDKFKDFFTAKPVREGYVVTIQE